MPDRWVRDCAPVEGWAAGGCRDGLTRRVPNRVPNSAVLTRSNPTQRHSNLHTEGKSPANSQLLIPRLEVRVLHGPLTYFQHDA